MIVDFERWPRNLSRRCPGWPEGSCLTVIPAHRDYCQFCKRSLKLAIQVDRTRRTKR